MPRTTRWMVAVPFALLLVITTGCEDPKARITQLEESNQQLLDQLQAAQDELMACRDANDACQHDLALARSSNMSQPVQPIQQAQPQVPDGWQAVPGGAMIAIEGSVLFDSGKVALRSGAKRTLDDVVSAVRSQYGDKDILVFGHTDNDPIKKSGWKDNFQLSAERALAVVRYLQGRGIAPERLAACGAGEYRPRVPNDSTANKGKNRRVEIFALDADMKTARR